MALWWRIVAATGAFKSEILRIFTGLYISSGPISARIPLSTSLRHPSERARRALPASIPWGDTEFAFLILKEAEVLASARDWTGMMAETLMLRTQLLLKEGRTRDAAICTERIETLARDHRRSSDDTFNAGHASVRAQVLVASGHACRGATILRELHAASCGKRNNY